MYNEALNEDKTHEYYMEIALEEAKKAFLLDEVPIGAVIVRNGEIIAKTHNTRNTDKNTLSHAEIKAIDIASKITGDWRLEDCIMYVTIEPCPMCAGAIVQARIPKVYFGARNKKAGCAGSVLNILNEPNFNQQVEVTEVILSDKCSEIMSEFFKNFRKNKTSEN